MVSGFALRTRLQEIVLWISLSEVEKDQGKIRSFVFVRGGLWSGLGGVGCRAALSQVASIWQHEDETFFFSLLTYLNHNHNTPSTKLCTTIQPRN